MFFRKLLFLIQLMIYLSFIPSLVTAGEVRVVGVTEPSQDIKVSFPIDGIISKVLVQEGDVVKKGAVLAQLDDALQSLEAKRRGIIWRDKSKLKSEKHKLEIISSLLQTTRKLYHESGSISEEEVKKLEIQHENAVGAFNSLKSIKRKEHVEYDIARSVLDKHILRSPIDGIVTEIFLEEGEWVRTGTAVARVINNSVGFLEVNIEENLVRQVNVGDSFAVNIEGRSLDTQGKVVFISPVADKASSLVKVKIRFVNNGKMILGNTAFVTLGSADQ